MTITDAYRNGSREQRDGIGLNRRFTHGRDALRAGGPVGRRRVWRYRFWRWPSFKRVVLIAGAITRSPDRSLPQQTQDWAELQGAYRFLNNPQVAPEQIQHIHRQRVRRQCRIRPLILAVQDTSELDFTHHPSVTGLGPIGNGGGQGLLQHATLAIDPRGDLLGVLNQFWRLRVPAPQGETRKRRLERPRESDFWPDSVRAVGSLGQTRIIHVTDRGGDEFETMIACREQENVGFLIRAQHDRCVNGGTDKLWSFLEKQPIRGDRDVPIENGKANERRIARVSIRYAPVSLDPPKQDPRFKKPIEGWAVYAREENAPAGVEHIEWMLLVSEALENLAEAEKRIDWYGLRWIIEEFHKAEKTGCRLETVQLKTAEALKRWAALVAVTAVRLIQMRDLAQGAVAETTDDPSSPSNQPQALQNLVPRTWLRIVAKLAKCEWIELTPRLFWLTIAKRGGYLGRKRDGPPGWLTLWRGWYDILLMVHGAELLAVIPETKSCV